MNKILPVLMVSGLLAPSVFCQSKTAVSPFNVFRVMEMVEEKRENPLWPNFSTTDIPVMIFDSVTTWLFHSRVKPEGFSEVQGYAGVSRVDGKHPLVRGNSIARMGTDWVATSIFSSHSARTGEKYSEQDLAGIIIHEQFHIFSRNKHPRWVPNDGVLLLYPPETEESLFLRRFEKEAFQQSVTSGTPVEISGWALLGLTYREQRLDGIPPIFGVYEKELQRTEGLSDYIEKIARRLDPLNTSNITNGIAPAGVRDLGYVEGRWIAMILDKLKPGWKEVLEGNDTLYLEDILKRQISESVVSSKSFPTVEIDIIKKKAHLDFMEWQAKKKREIEEFGNLPGFRIEIHASAKPLNIQIFEPLEIEIIEHGRVFHRVIFSAGSDAGSIRVMNQPCITTFDNSLRFREILVNGLTEAPKIIENENKIVLKDNNITIDLKYSKMTVERLLYVIEL